MNNNDLLSLHPYLASEFIYQAQDIIDSLFPVLMKNAGDYPEFDVEREKHNFKHQLLKFLAKQDWLGIKTGTGQRVQKRFSKWMCCDIALHMVMKSLPMFQGCSELPLPQYHVYTPHFSGYGLHYLDGYAEDHELVVSYVPCSATVDGSGMHSMSVRKRSDANKPDFVLGEIRINLWWMSGFLKNLETQSGGQ
ncbi:MAG: hypothetical protein OXH65_03780 [Paracoccaceae bacterium]|nr:hypothetical protein [Paracoccaceae bacterium]